MKNTRSECLKMLSKHKGKCLFIAQIIGITTLKLLFSSTSRPVNMSTN